MTSLTATARWTGAAYLGLAVTGMAAHLVLTPQLVRPGDPAATLQVLRESPALGQLALLAELLVVVTQALTAWGFFALLHRDRPAAAFAVASFGMANAVVLLGGTAFRAVAALVAGDAGLAPGGDAAATVALMFELSDAAWTAGAVFFGLWLIPMGAFVLGTRRMPLVLGWALVIGGAGYVLSALLTPIPSLAPVGEALAYLATVGELWMIGYLLTVGIRPATAPASA